MLATAKGSNVMLDFPQGKTRFVDTHEPIKSRFQDLDGKIHTSWNPADYEMGRVLVGNTKNRIWRLYYYEYIADDQPKFVITENFGRLWLKDNMGIIVLSYEDPNRSCPPNRNLYLDRLLYMVNLVLTKQPLLWPPYLDSSDITNQRGLGMIPYNDSGNLAGNFDGEFYPLPNFKKWKGTWLGNLIQSGKEYIPVMNVVPLNACSIEKVALLSPLNNWRAYYDIVQSRFRNLFTFPSLLSLTSWCTSMSTSMSIE